MPETGTADDSGLPPDAPSPADGAGALSSAIQCGVRRPLIPLLLTTVIVLILDLVTKSVAASALQPGRAVPIIGDYLRLILVYNSGAAFGLFPGSRGVFIVFSIAAIVLLLLLYWRLPAHSRWQLIAMGGLLGGALGNLHDRLRSGVVIDFIEIGVGRFHWPVFNVADMAVTGGVVLLLLGVARRPN